MTEGLRAIDRISQVREADWDSLLGPRATPFVRWAWLEALESSGNVGPRRGWRPRHLVLHRAGRLVAAAPAYARTGSDGDFSRDWDLAALAARARRPFYPKLVVGVPFTPCTGSRLLVAPGEDRTSLAAELLQGARRLCEQEGLHAIEVLFPPEEEAVLLERLGCALRVDFQYHWQNGGCRSVDDYLARFDSKRRSMIRRERAAPAKQGILLRTVEGAELAQDAARWGRLIHELHSATLERLPWGRGWLDHAFYEAVIARMPAHVELVEARRDGRTIACAFNVASADRLYGRVWGCIEEHPFLHFNTCLYHSIERCVAKGTSVFEGGAGGDHKLARGFLPTLTYTAFDLQEPALAGLVGRLLAAERPAREAALARWRESVAKGREPGPGPASDEPDPTQADGSDAPARQTR
jgi:predicted N-acyltransferase